jgi:hypothetical protein
MYSREERKLYQRVYRTRTKYTRADKEAEYQREYAARKRIDNNSTPTTTSGESGGS